MSANPIPEQSEQLTSPSNPAPITTADEKSPIDPEVFALEYKRTGKFYDAYIAAGYSEHTAVKGRAAMSQKLYSALAEEGVKLGKVFTAEQRADFVVGKLMENAILGKDSGVQSLKLLGMDRRVNLFVPDSQVGVIVLQAPSNQSLAEELPLAKPSDIIEAE